MYNHTVGAAITYVTGGLTGIVLTPVELFFVDATTAILAFFGGLLGYVEDLVSGIVSIEESIAMSMGPVVAVLALVAILATIMIVLRVVVELF